MKNYTRNGHQSKLTEKDSSNPTKGVSESYNTGDAVGPKQKDKRELVNPGNNMYEGSQEKSKKTGGNMKAPHVATAKGDHLIASSAERSIGPNPQYLGNGGTSAPSAANPVKEGNWGHGETFGKAELDLNAL